MCESVSERVRACVRACVVCACVRVFAMWGLIG